MYSVKLITNTIFGCTDTLLQSNYVKIAATPKVKILGNSIGCAPTQITFAGALIKPDTSAIKWNWVFDNGNTSSLQMPPTQPYNNAGVYNIRLIASIAEGCSDTAKYITTIFNKPIVDAGQGGTICNNQTIKLIPAGADTYTWNSNASLSCLLCDTTLANPKVKTTYYVTGTTINGCTNSDSVVVDVKQPFKITVSKGDSICKGEFASLNAFGTDNFEWKPPTWLNNPNVSNPISQPDTSITYMVVGQDSANCYTDTGYVKIKVYPIPFVNITNGNLVTLEVGKTVILNTQTSLDVISFLWAPPQGLSCTSCSNPTVSTRENITYKVKASNAGNCSSTDEIKVSMLCGKASIFVPNTFSPNGDGMNDVFYPRGNGLGQVKSLRIFNRWGQVVFQKTNFTANDASMGWDGRMNGTDLPSDVYVYFLEVYCINNEVVTFKDNVSLLR